MILIKYNSNQFYQYNYLKQEQRTRGNVYISFVLEKMHIYNEVKGDNIKYILN